MQGVHPRRWLNCDVQYQCLCRCNNHPVAEDHKTVTSSAGSGSSTSVDDGGHYRAVFTLDDSTYVDDDGGNVDPSMCLMNSTNEYKRPSRQIRVQTTKSAKSQQTAAHVNKQAATEWLSKQHGCSRPLVFATFPDKLIARRRASAGPCRNWAKKVMLFLTD